ncbi:prolyl 4-hydroxylase subunit alpha-1-like [Drosophila elegans]|uniref:prolyl 4-hydroxylase subunit alpha-1-like n=1 Tax=Drosophila elegans TaxID=30023 RepID=UPI0007E867B2|nr:prolyl 4-hydroxylase subunit alpha-1-like [Drosophila elegans]
MLLLFIALTTGVVLQVKGQVMSTPISDDFTISLESQLSLLKFKEAQANNLLTYREALDAQLKEIKLAIYHTENLLRSASHFQHNLIFEFKVLRHIYKDWPQYFKLLKKELGTAEISLSQELLTRQPTSVDFTESLRAIYRLQTVYNLDSSDMAEGILDGFDYNVQKWGIDECLVLGLMYQYLKNYDLSEYWLKLALHQYEEHPNRDVLKIKLWKYHNLLEFLMEANKGLGRYVAAKEFANELISIFPNQMYAIKQLAKLEYLQANPLNLTETKKDYQVQKAICSKPYPKKVSVNLICRYVNWTPFLKLAPLKLEELAINPSLVIIPDFVGEKDMEILKNVARPKLKRNEHLSWNCSCKISTLSSSSHNIVGKINHQITDIIGFPRNGNQVLEVINYGIAGNYNPHDTLRSPSNSIANALIYLSNAEKGGEIVFPSVEVKIKPQKGTLLVWVNPKESIFYHQCPLLKGNMWLANKMLN